MYRRQRHSPSGKWKYLKAKHNVYGYARDTQRKEVEELYDLEADIGETKNLAKKHPEIVSELKRLMGEIMQSYSEGNDRMKKVILTLFVMRFALLVSAVDVTKQPNIVLIMADDMGFSDIGCYGSEIKTPTLDRLARNGIRFTQFYNTSRCCPTRASLLTGMYPHQAGIGLMTGDNKLPGYRGELGRDVVTYRRGTKRRAVTAGT